MEMQNCSGECHGKRSVSSRGGDTKVELVNSFDRKVGSDDTRRLELTQDRVKWPG
jgi:hypothetical protein